MADNPNVNKVEYDGQTLIDLTSDTATPSDVLSGVTFHDRSGAPQQGSLITHNVYDGLDSTSASDALSAKQGKVLNDKIKVIHSENLTKTFSSNGDANLSLSFSNYIVLSVVDNDSSIDGKVYLPYRYNSSNWGAHGITDTAAHSVVTGSHSVTVFYVDR